MKGIVGSYQANGASIPHPSNVNQRRGSNRMQLGWNDVGLLTIDTTRECPWHEVVVMPVIVVMLSLIVSGVLAAWGQERRQVMVLVAGFGVVVAGVWVAIVVTMLAPVLVLLVLMLVMAVVEVLILEQATGR
jgi:hypothetical protein